MPDDVCIAVLDVTVSCAHCLDFALHNALHVQTDHQERDEVSFRILVRQATGRLYTSRLRCASALLQHAAGDSM
jgi:hypothetical protein